VHGRNLSHATRLPLRVGREGLDGSHAPAGIALMAGEASGLLDAWASSPEISLLNKLPIASKLPVVSLREYRVRCFHSGKPLVEARSAMAPSSLIPGPGREPRHRSLVGRSSTILLDALITECLRGGEHRLRAAVASGTTHGRSWRDCPLVSLSIHVGRGREHAG